MQGQLDINFLVQEYQKKVGELTNELIMKDAYIKQLEKQILDEAEAKTKQESTEE